MTNSISLFYIAFVVIFCHHGRCRAQDTCPMRLSVSARPTTPAVGDFLSLSCLVNEEDLATASWYQDGMMVQLGSRHYRGENDLGNGCWNFGLLILGATSNDTGSFTCRVGNMTSAAMELNVVYEPTCEVAFHKDSQIDAGAIVRLSCQTQTGYPPWSPSWSSDGITAEGEMISSENGYATSLLELPATDDVLQSTFTCSSSCSPTQDANCSTSDVRTCTTEGALFSVSPRQQTVAFGGDAVFKCETSVRHYTVAWLVSGNIGLLEGFSVECEPGNQLCNITISNASTGVNGSEFACNFLSDLNENILVRRVVLNIDPDTVPTTVVTTILSSSTTMTTSVSTVMSTSQPPTTKFITPPPPPPITSPPSTPSPSTTPPTMPPTTPRPTAATTTPSPIPSPTTPQTPPPVITTRRLPPTRRPPPTQSGTSLPGTNATSVTAGPSTGGIGSTEIIAIVVTVAILLIVLVIIFAFMAVLGKSKEKQGKLRRDPMLDSQAPSPFNPYDMQSVLSFGSGVEMSGPSEKKQKLSIGEGQDYLIPITDPDLEEDAGDTTDQAYDNKGHDPHYVSIPPNSETPTEMSFPNGSIDQGYYEHYPDPDLGESALVRGIISTAL